MGDESIPSQSAKPRELEIMMKYDEGREILRNELMEDMARQKLIAQRQSEIEKELDEMIALKEAHVASLRAKNHAEKERLRASRTLFGLR